MHDDFSLLHWLRLVLWPILGNFPCALGKMYFLLSLDGMLWIYLLDPSGPMYHLKPQFPCWFSVCSFVFKRINIFLTWQNIHYSFGMFFIVFVFSKFFIGDFRVCCSSFMLIVFFMRRIILDCMLVYGWDIQPFLEALYELSLGWEGLENILWTFRLHFIWASKQISLFTMDHQTTTYERHVYFFASYEVYIIVDRGEIPPDCWYLGAGSGKLGLPVFL